jgi:hypothetical protein
MTITSFSALALLDLSNRRWGQCILNGGRWPRFFFFFLFYHLLCPEEKKKIKTFLIALLNFLNKNS